LIQRATRHYGKYAEHIYFSEGIGNIGVQQVWDMVKKHQGFTGQTPVIVIDYLQLLAPHSDRATDKQATDKAVLELKRLSREERTPVIVISSFNRASYHGPVTMEAFKESGAIEYSTDVLLGLQPAGLILGSSKKTETGNKVVMHNCKNQIPRQVEVFILKNRSGQTHKGTTFTYQPLFNHFNEGQEIDLAVGDFEPY
jgi:replicative DNA helicase